MNFNFEDNDSNQEDNRDISNAELIEAALESSSDDGHLNQEMSNAELIEAALEIGNLSFFKSNKASTNDAYLRKVAKFKVTYCKIKKLEMV